MIEREIQILLRGVVVFVVVLFLLIIIAGCAVAFGDGSTVCVDINTRSALAFDTEIPRAEPKAGDVTCMGANR
jgi:hypothetical protein